VPPVRKPRANWDGKPSLPTLRQGAAVDAGVGLPARVGACDGSPVESGLDGGDEREESSLEDSPIPSCHPRIPAEESRPVHGASVDTAEVGTYPVAVPPPIHRHDLQELEQTMALESERALASKRLVAQCQEAPSSSGGEPVKRSQSKTAERSKSEPIDDRQLLEMLRDERHPWVFESIQRDGAVAGGATWIAVPSGSHQKGTQRRPVLERPPTEASASSGGSRYSALHHRASGPQGKSGVKSDDSYDDTEAEDESMAGAREARENRGRPNSRTNREEAGRRVDFEGATANHRRLRESASASQAVREEELASTAAKTAQTIEMGRQSAYAQQQLARQTLHGFFPDRPVRSAAAPPQGASWSGVAAADDDEVEQQENGVLVSPQTVELGAMGESRPAALAPKASSDEAATVVEKCDAQECDAQGLLQLKLLRNYFVPREPSAYSPLAAAVLAPTPPSIDLLEQLLATPGTDVNSGGSCGWQPLSLTLLGGDARIGIVRMLIRWSADVEAVPTGRPQQTPLLLAASARQTKCVQALLAASACVNARDRDGQTALLHCAAWHPDERAVSACELLIDRSADFTIRSPSGQLAAVARALQVGNGKTATMLQTRAEAARELAEQQLTDADDGISYEGGRSASGPKKARQAGHKNAASGKSKPGRAH